MKKSFDILIWALLLFLITPSSMALASWNAVPGDYTYAWKLSLEKVLLWFLSPSDTLQSSTQVKIAERRFSEVEQVLDSEYAVESLDNLNKQIDVASADIQKISKDTDRSELTEQYVVSLKKMSSTLDEQKIKAQTGEITVVPQKTTGTAKPAATTKTNFVTAQPTSTTIRPSVAPSAAPTALPVNPTNTSVNETITDVTATPTSIPSPTQTTTIDQNVVLQPTKDTEEVVGKIDETKKKIEEKIKELEKENKTREDKAKSEKNDSEDKKEDDNKQDTNTTDSRKYQIL